MVIGRAGLDRVHVKAAIFLVHLVMQPVQALFTRLIRDILRVALDMAVFPVHDGHVLQDQPVQQLALVPLGHAHGPGDQPVHLRNVVDVVDEAAQHHVHGVDHVPQPVQRAVPHLP